MIIKSLSRKKPSFEQLYDYMLNGADDKEILITRNLLKYNDKESVINQFDKNYNLLTKRKNTNALYHEIISLPHQKNMDIKKQKEIIQDLANQYLDNRTNNNLCFGVIHEEKEHLHCHLMISSNAKGSYTRHRLARAEFNEIRREVERYKLEKFPELEGKILYNQERDIELYKSNKSEEREYQYKKRTKRESQKEELRSNIVELMSDSYSKEQFEKKLDKNNYKLYKRGNTVGIIDLKAQERGVKKYKHRLKTLDLIEEYTNLLEFEKSFEEEWKIHELNQELEKDLDDLEDDNYTRE